MASGTAVVLVRFPGGQNCSQGSENSFAAFVHDNILTSFVICSLSGLGRVESRLFAEQPVASLTRFGQKRFPGDFSNIAWSAGGGPVDTALSNQNRLHVHVGSCVWGGDYAVRNSMCSNPMDS